MISNEEIKHIAKLSRLELSGAEIEKMQKDLSSILDYFELLKKAPKSSKTTGDIKTELNAIRKDESRQSNLADELLAAAPDKKEAYVKVKAIL
jgi:aspartyl-tRNA(Asn)/glutamyl-tRNA(Gln) amidotransferase subunit C